MNTLRIVPKLIVFPRFPIERALRAQVWAKTNGQCWYCGAETNPFIDFRIDHIVPVVSGGRNHINNLVPACDACNGRKGARSYQEFRSILGGGLFWAEIEGLA